MSSEGLSGSRKVEPHREFAALPYACSTIRDWLVRRIENEPKLAGICGARRQTHFMYVAMDAKM